jgi:hypothetical protein
MMPRGRVRARRPALAAGADPLHLALVFNIDHTNAMAYANAARNLLTSPAEQALSRRSGTGMKAQRRARAPARGVRYGLGTLTWRGGWSGSDSGPAGLVSCSGSHPLLLSFH